MDRSVSVILPARSDPAMTSRALSSLVLSFAKLKVTPQFILIDDHSSDRDLHKVFAQFKKNHGGTHEVIIASTLTRFHYTGVFSLGLDLAKGDDVFFISNDMVTTPSFVHALRSVSQMSPSYGIVRGTSNYTDSHPEHQVTPDRKMKTYLEYSQFAEEHYRKFGDFHVEDRLLSGDAVLVKREVIDKIGLLDTAFYGYFGDIDYGLRTQLAGFKLVCAKGGWLYHKGGGHIHYEITTEKVAPKKVHENREELVAAAFEVFATKWALRGFTGTTNDLPVELLRHQNADEPIEKVAFPAILRSSYRIDT